ncbi:hypothetical protein E1B22_12175 [Thermaerobacter sp. FW80]|uniref:hypothetical protein n=1 Tax=Thermaerobacter sp. FW80 TaxID=2546351 RepID=UPI0010753DC8|nr:hypothetical protein [Thermaerobacter sp. FW80]QBS38364.1 hypothetical protein E1B22_12175 [Thermaerobacter sp. FW80]
MIALYNRRLFLHEREIDSPVDVQEGMVRRQHVVEEDLIEEVPLLIQPSQHGAPAPVSVSSP